MSRKLLIVLTTIALSSCAHQADAPDPNPDSDLVARAGAPLFEGMGDHHHPITTSEPGAQRYFDQGLTIDFAFNHAESARSFRAAQKLDPQCAMCYWGEALALGPNINVTSNGKAIMSPADREAAYLAVQKAVSLKHKASAAERDYIDALASRYSADFEAPREPQDQAYAAAMRALHEKYPADDDAAALYAEALMNTMPWDYWLDPEHPKPNTVEVIETLEGVLARNPRHPMALHLYIHAVEASSQPQRAEAHADTLADLVPGAGHLVHMPAHIYWRVGRYEDAAQANVRAAAVDEAYIAACNAQGFYPAMYYPHNIHFLWAASSMMGQSAVSLDAARRVSANVGMDMIAMYPPLEFFHTIPLLALVQFSRWDEVLAEPQPRADLDYSNAIWHYARAVALARKGDTGAAQVEQVALRGLLDTDKIMTIDANDYPASTLLKIADELVAGELAMAGGQVDVAIGHFRTAVATQDKLPYTEPPFWYYPTRRTLGAALMTAGQAAEAEAVYRTDLEQYPHNGWSLFGLTRALAAQGKTAEAAEMRHHFEEAWQFADVEL